MRSAVIALTILLSWPARAVWQRVSLVVPLLLAPLLLYLYVPLALSASIAGHHLCGPEFDGYLSDTSPWERYIPLLQVVLATVVLLATLRSILQVAMDSRSVALKFKDSISRAAILATLVAGLFQTAQVQADASDPANELKEATVQVEFVIVKSTANYQEARRMAMKAATSLRIPLKLRDLSPTPKGGLSFPDKVCEENGWDAPCYVARGRFDDGEYVSVEHTSAYPEFKPNLYIVMVASSHKGDPSIKKFERAARRIFPDAYARVAGVYIGCMH
jgi:hypothetical protein